MERWFALNGARLQVIAEDEAFIAPLLPYLDELSAEAGPPAAFVLSILRDGVRSPPADAELLFDGPMPDGLAYVLAQDRATRWLNIGEDLSLEISRTESWARLRVRAGAEPLMGWIPAIVAVDAALQASRQYLTHAAALRLPGSEAGILVFARSGAGKTTTALGLALAGFGLLTDDATVLVPPGAMGSSEFSIWGLPRSLKVHRRTSELLPQIGRLLGPDWNAEGEQVLARGSLKGVVDVCAPAACPLAAIIMLQPRVQGGHVLEPVAKTELMVSLADDNVQRGPKGLLPDQLERFQVLAAAVAATPAYALHVGTDLPSLGALVHAVIGGAAMKRRNDASRST